MLAIIGIFLKVGTCVRCLDEIAVGVIFERNGSSNGIGQPGNAVLSITGHIDDTAHGVGNTVEVTAGVIGECNGVAVCIWDRGQFAGGAVYQVNQLITGGKAVCTVTIVHQCFKGIGRAQKTAAAIRQKFLLMAVTVLNRGDASAVDSNIDVIVMRPPVA